MRTARATSGYSTSRRRMSTPARTGKPYFEVLMVTPTEPSAWERLGDEMRRLRRAEDAFHYETVHVGSFEDAMLAVMVNDDLQAVVLVDGFQFASRHDMPDLQGVPRAARHRRHLERRAGRSWRRRSRKASRTTGPSSTSTCCPTAPPESIAGSDEAAPIRRMFHHVEEPMEIHLSILDGIKDRYETPYFDNLKKYAQRPIGTFHALPIARGKSVFRSNWIRDMGQFYGTNIFFAESSATTGGLDSLLEPTGNIKKAQEAAARAFGAQARLLRHQRHLDLEQDRGAGGLQAGRHRHRRPQLPQVAPLRLRALGRAAVLRRGVSR